MKIYTASAFANIERVRRFNEDARAAGHEITNDWTLIGGNKTDLELTVDEARHIACLNRDGVMAAELLVALFDEGRPNGGLIEFGGGVFAGKSCWILRPKEWGEGIRYTIFYRLPNVTVVDDEDAIRGPLGMAFLEQIPDVVSTTAPHRTSNVAGPDAWDR